MKKINFSTNWNGKLGCSVYTTIRLQNISKYKTGDLYDVRLNGKPHHKAKILGIKTLPSIYHLSSFVCYLDTGYSAEETIGIFEKMYKAKVRNLQVQPFSIILLKKEKDA